MRISDWSSDVCSSDLVAVRPERPLRAARRSAGVEDRRLVVAVEVDARPVARRQARPAFGVPDDILERGRPVDRRSRQRDDPLLDTGHPVAMIAQPIVAFGLADQQLDTPTPNATDP